MMKGIKNKLEQAKALEHTDDFDKAVVLFQEAFSYYRKNSDFDNASAFDEAARVYEKSGYADYHICAKAYKVRKEHFFTFSYAQS